MNADNNQNRISVRADAGFVSNVERDELLLVLALKIEDLESRIRQLEAATLWTSPWASWPISRSN